MHTGLMVLKGDGGISEVWRNVMDEPPASLAIGNARNPETTFFDTAPETSMEEVLLTIHRKLPIEPYSYMLWSDEKNRLTSIPTRGATIGIWMDGGTIGKDHENDPVRLLTRLNTAPATESGGNYTQLVKERVIQKMVGPKWAMSLVYVGVAKPSIILSTKKMRMYMWLMVINNTYLLIWSTQMNLVNSMMSKLDQIRQHQVFTTPIDFGDSDMLTIHPMYLISKINQNIKKYTDPGSRKLLSCTYIKNYIERMTQRVQFDQEETDDNG